MLFIYTIRKVLKKAVEVVQHTIRKVIKKPTTVLGNDVDETSSTAVVMSLQSQSLLNDMEIEINRFGGNAQEALQKGFLKKIMIQFARQFTEDNKQLIELMLRTGHTIAITPTKINEIRSLVQDIKNSEVHANLDIDRAKEIIKYTDMQYVLNPTKK